VNALKRLVSRLRHGAEIDAAMDRHPAGNQTAAAAPTVVILPAGLTCLRCEENPALPDRIWCAVCAPIIDALPAEPVERGAK
jgi:hypothetical protein